MKRVAEKTGKRLSLYPLKFKEVIADVLKVKPEPKQPKKEVTTKSRKSRVRDSAVG